MTVSVKDSIKTYGLQVELLGLDLHPVPFGFALLEVKGPSRLATLLAMPLSLLMLLA